MRPTFRLLLCALTLGASTSCRTDYADLPTFSAERKLLQVVVEMPAGTNHEQRYDAATNSFKPVQQAGTDQVVEFVPAPGNLGFIPGTEVAASDLHPAGGPLPALVLAESQPAGTVLEVMPVAVLLLELNGGLGQVVLAVPARPAQRLLPDITDWETLNRRYPGVRQSLSLWFQHRTHPAETHIVGWKDEKFAEQQIRNRMK